MLCNCCFVTHLQVVLAPCLADVAYKRLRNLGYGSFVLPDLQVGVVSPFGAKRFGFCFGSIFGSAQALFAVVIV
jgi:hypothetical protein